MSILHSIGNTPLVKIDNPHGSKFSNIYVKLEEFNPGGSVKSRVGMQMIEDAEEIHPAAQIGERFILDHGIGTVIGETVVIGDDCYILQSVILGSSQISNNVMSVRHPVIGNNVEIGGFVKIYGRIEVGDNVKISPGAIIKKSIPKDSRVIVDPSYQIIKVNGIQNLVFTGYYHGEGRLILFFYGNNLKKYKYIDVHKGEERIDDIQFTERSVIISGLESYEGEYEMLFNNQYEFRVCVRF